jgi:hypothetical protein
MDTKADILRILVVYLFVKGAVFLPLAWVAFVLSRHSKQVEALESSVPTAAETTPPQDPEVPLAA